MSAGNSIIAKMGLDLNGLRADFSAAEKLAIRASNQMQSEMNRAQKGGGKHGGGGSNNRAIGDALDSITGEKGWVMRMTMLQHSLPIAAVGALAVGLEKAHEAFEELVKASEHAHEVLSKPMDIAIKQAGGSVSTYIEGLKKAQDDLHEKNHGLAGVGSTIWAGVNQGMAKFGNAMRGDAANDDRNQIVLARQREEALEKRRLEAAVKYKQLTNDQIEERKQAAAVGGKELEIVTARQRMEKEIADIQSSAPTETMSTQVNERRAAFALEKDEIARKHVALDRENDLQHALLKIKMIGRDVAVEEAQARLDAAVKESEAAQGRPDDHAAAQIKVQAASNALTDAKNATTEHRAQLAIAQAIANYRGPEEIKHLMTLQAERTELERQLKLVGEQADKRRDINKEIAENESKQRAAQRAGARGVFDRVNTMIDATTGTGEAARMENVSRKLAAAKHYRDNIAQNPEVSREDKNKASAQVTQLQNQFKEMVEARQKSARSAVNETDVMTEQLAKHEAIAEALRTQHEYSERIYQAYKDGDTVLTAQLQKQQQLSLLLQIQKLKTEVGDRSKATLSELAGHAFNQDGAKARAAMRLEKRADTERMRGHQANAKKLQDQADKIKGGIGPLKNAEKSAGLLQDQLTELQKIANNTLTTGKVQ